MDALVQARPYILATFFIALVAIGVGSFNQTMGLLRVSGVLAHVMLFLFILTESFGSVSRQRSRFSRNMARVFLVFSGFLVLNIVANLFSVVFSI